MTEQTNPPTEQRDTTQTELDQLNEDQFLLRVEPLIEEVKENLKEEYTKSIIATYILGVVVTMIGFYFGGMKGAIIGAFGGFVIVQATISGVGLKPKEKAE